MKNNRRNRYRERPHVFAHEKKKNEPERVFSFKATDILKVTFFQKLYDAVIAGKSFPNESGLTAVLKLVLNRVAIAREKVFLPARTRSKLEIPCRS